MQNNIIKSFYIIGVIIIIIFIIIAIFILIDFSNDYLCSITDDAQWFIKHNCVKYIMR